MSKTTGILSLGTRKDASTWEKGCKRLGFDAPSPIKEPKPSFKELETFFATSPHWIFLAGHFGDLTLTNESQSVEIKFEDHGVEVNLAGDTRNFSKKDDKFSLQKNCEVVLWGGCSVCRGEDTIRTLRKLFGDHVLLGFAGLTGWRMVDAILGGGFLRTGHFFDRLSSTKANSITIRNAWMKAAQKGYGGGKNESRFRAIDPNGQEWRLSNNSIVRGRSFR